MEKVLLAAEAGGQGKDQPFEPKVGKNQRRYCKEEGHWARDCPQIRNKPKASTGSGRKPTPSLLPWKKTETKGDGAQLPSPSLG